MERIKLNLIPSGVAPIVHLSQYDDGRQFGIDLFEGESVYVLDGTETLTVNSRKPDGHVVTLAVTNAGTSSVDVDTIEQLTAVHGVSYAKLQIVKGSVTIATLPFLIDVSRDPLENGDPSESFIDNLNTQIAEAVSEQYDSNNVFFDNVPTSGHGIGYAVTSEGVKSQIDTLNTALAGKVDTTDFDATNLPITSGSTTSTKDYIDVVNARLVVATLTWNGSYFTIPSAKGRPFGNLQTSVLGRNLQNGAVYAVWYDDSVDAFRLSATLVGNAPSSNNTITVQYFA